MAKLLFLNLPVSDLGRSVAFYEAVGFAKDPRFSDGTAACMTVSETFHVMLLTHDKFGQFSPRPIAAVRAASGALFCISAESRDEVNEVVAKAGAAGGRIDPSPVDEYEFMFGRSFEDPDGHLWGVNWMDMAAFEAMSAGKHAA